jgi:dihydrofolate synthase / folylpolyglutamate synthase
MIAVAMRSLADWLSYAETVHKVGIDLGLDRVRRVARRLDLLPPAAENFVIAGTNGKGSTSVYLEALLRATGRRVGTTLSPHLSRFNERIRVNGDQVDDDLICDAFKTIDAIRDEVTLTYFEFGILAALWVFKHVGVDATVLEVGLGGRLDAVNIVDANVATITSIGIDHVNYLGPDRESIGREKAGILRRGIPAVYGESSIPASIVAVARELDVRLLRYGVDFDARQTSLGWEFRGVRKGSPITLHGLATPSVALSNAATALQTFLLRDHDSDVDAAVRGAATARLPGRFEHFSLRATTAIVDVAHNPHGATFLAAQLRSTRPSGRTVAIGGFLQDKDVQGIVAALDDQVDEWIFVDTQGGRGQAASTSAEKARIERPFRVAESDLAVTLSTLSARLSENDRVVVLGCFDLAQRARALLSSGSNDLD